MIPVPKTRPLMGIENDLRPISLTSTLGKQLEAIVGRRIPEHIGPQLDTRQFGALKGRSTVHALVDMLHNWYKALDQRQSVRTLFIDYSKAFDHVDHATVVRKLLAFGLHDVLIRWFC
jgi:hypothetical protein